MPWFIWLLIAFVGLRLLVLGYRFAKNTEWGALTVFTDILEVGSIALIWWVVGLTWQTFAMLFALRFLMILEIQLVLQFCANGAKEYNGFYVRKKK